MRKHNRSSRIDKLFSRLNGGGAHIGMDAHKKSINVAVWAGGMIIGEWVTAADYEAIVETLSPHKDRIALVVYEAGPTGYKLARRLIEAGVSTDVIAPGKTPRPAARENKSDSVDAKKLAEYSAKGLLQRVAIPTEVQEADRQVLRLREQVVEKRREIKQQIKSFLLQHGISEPGGLSAWSKASVAALKTIPLNGELRFCLDIMLKELSHQDEQLKEVTENLKRLSLEKRHCVKAKILRSHPGVGLITSMSFILEVYRSGGRFREKCEVSKYVGLAPMVRISAENRRECGILRTGRGSVRSILVESAWRWTSLDPEAKKVYRRLVSNTGSGKKAIVGMARRLAIRLYTMLENGTFYRKTG